MSWSKALALLINLEGGYRLSYDTGGGNTYAGVTEAVWITAGNPPYWQGLPSDEQVAELYWKEFWKPAYCDQLPEDADAVMLQMVVNCGVKTAIGLLQCAVGAYPIDMDFGPKTLAATQRVSRSEFPDLLLAAQDTYYRFGRRNQNYEKGLEDRTVSVRNWLRGSV